MTGAFHEDVYRRLRVVCLGDEPLHFGRCLFANVDHLHALLSETPDSTTIIGHPGRPPIFRPSTLHEFGLTRSGRNATFLALVGWKPRIPLGRPSWRAHPISLTRL